MRVSSYVIPEDEEESNMCNVWIKTDNGDEYDVSVGYSGDEYRAKSIDRVIADISLRRRSSEEVEKMKEIAIKTVRSIHHIDAEYE